MRALDMSFLRRYFCSRLDEEHAMRKWCRSRQRTDTSVELITEDPNCRQTHRFSVKQPGRV